MRWLLGSDGVTEERDWRNIIAHNAGVPKPYERSDEDKIVNRCFEPKRFLEEGLPILQDLKADLEQFLSWLDQDIDNYPVLEVEEPVYDAYNEHAFLTELLAEKHEDIVVFQDEEDRFQARSESCQEQADKIKQFYLDKASDMSADSCQQALATETEMYDVRARKMARVREIWEQREAAAAQAASQWTSYESEMSGASSWADGEEFDWESAGAQTETDTELDSEDKGRWCPVDDKRERTAWVVGGTVSASSLADDVGEDAEKTDVKEGKQSWSFRRVMGIALKGFETAVRCQQVGEGLLAGVPRR